MTINRALPYFCDTTRVPLLRRDCRYYIRFCSKQRQEDFDQRNCFEIAESTVIATIEGGAYVELGALVSLSANEENRKKLKAECPPCSPVTQSGTKVEDLDGVFFTLQVQMSNVMQARAVVLNYCASKRDQVSLANADTGGGGAPM